MIGIPEKKNYFCKGIQDENEETSEHLKAVIDKFQEEELKIKDTRRKIEFHCLGKKDRNGPRPMLARFLDFPTARTFYRKHARNLKILTLPFMRTFLRICMTSKKVK